MSTNNKLLIFYGLSCVAIIYIYYNHTKMVEKEVSELRAQQTSIIKKYEDAVADKASKQ